MSLVFSAIVPHPPIIIPDIGKDNISNVQKTIKAMEELEGDLYTMQPDIIFIISPHSPITPKAFSLNLANKFKSNFQEFGPVDKEIKLKPEMELVSKIKEEADKQDVPVNIISEGTIDHGASVPLYYLTRHLPEIKIIPISYCWLDLESHLKFGQLLHKIADKSNKRVAIIASGDLSHRLSPDSLTGYSPEGKTFDNLLINFLEQDKNDEILKFNPDMIEAAGECGLRSFIVLLGALQKNNLRFKKLSYEAPFGVGYLVGEYVSK